MWPCGFAEQVWRSLSSCTCETCARKISTAVECTISFFKWKSQRRSQEVYLSRQAVICLPSLNWKQIDIIMSVDSSLHIVDRSPNKGPIRDFLCLECTCLIQTPLSLLKISCYFQSTFSAKLCLVLLANSNGLRSLDLSLTIDVQLYSCPITVNPL